MQREWAVRVFFAENGYDPILQPAFRDSIGWVFGLWKFSESCNATVLAVLVVMRSPVVAWKLRMRIDHKGSL
jgi:hypothetical protein